MEVSKPNSRQSSKREVSNNKHFIKPTIILELKVVNEPYILAFHTFQSGQIKIWWVVRFSQIAENVPKYTYKVRNCENDNNQFECLEEI